MTVFILARHEQFWKVQHHRELIFEDGIELTQKKRNLEGKNQVRDKKYDREEERQTGNEGKREKLEENGRKNSNQHK